MNCLTSALSVKSADGPVPFTADEQTVMAELYFYRGQGNPLSIKSIVKRTDISERDIKAAVEGLRLRHLFAIGSSRKKTNPGYYIIETAEDLDATCGPLLRQAVSMLRVVKALNGHNARRWRELKGQLLMEVEG